MCILTFVKGGIFCHFETYRLQAFDNFCAFPMQSGKFGSTPSDRQENQPQGLESAEDVAEHENMKAVLRSSLQGADSTTSTLPGLRSRTRASSTRGQHHKYRPIHIHHPGYGYDIVQDSLVVPLYTCRLVFFTHCDFPSGRVPPWCTTNDDPVNCTDDTADEIMERIVRSATQGPSPRTLPRERRRSRANRKSCELCDAILIWKNYLPQQHYCVISPSFLCSEENIEEWPDDRRSQRSWLVQWFRNAGVSWISLDMKMLVLAPPMPTSHTLHSGLAQDGPALRSWSPISLHYVYTGFV